MASNQEIARLEELAFEMRKRLLSFCGSYDGTAHIGGDLSLTDILIALYNYGLHVDPKDISLPTRDRFIVSKGHGARRCRCCPMLLPLHFSGLLRHVKIHREKCMRVSSRKAFLDGLPSARRICLLFRS